MKTNRTDSLQRLILAAIALTSGDLLAQQPGVPVQTSVATTTTTAASFAATLPFQNEAMAKYPELGRAGSSFNREFLARVQRRQNVDLVFFQDTRWPLVMAEEVAADGFSSTAVSATPSTAQPVQGANQVRPLRPGLLGRIVVAPTEAPPVVHYAVAAGNMLQDKPYKWGGGHARLEDSGYDCSGSVSYVLRKAGLLGSVLTSSSFASYGHPGPGRWITIHAGRGHVFMTICGLRFDTGGRRGSGETGPRWSSLPRYAAGFVERHPPGF